jgi:hypothetical protein
MRIEGIIVVLKYLRSNLDQCNYKLGSETDVGVKMLGAK